MIGSAADGLIYCARRRSDRGPRGNVFHVSISEVVVVLVVWLAVTGGPVLAGLLLGLRRRVRESGRQTPE